MNPRAIVLLIILCLVTFGGLLHISEAEITDIILYGSGVGIMTLYFIGDLVT